MEFSMEKKHRPLAVSRCKPAMAGAHCWVSEARRRSLSEASSDSGTWSRRVPARMMGAPDAKT